MKSDRGSYVRAVESEMKGITDDLKRDWSRALFGTSDGVLAATETSSTTNVILLDAATPRAILQAFREGATVDIGTVGSPTAVASQRDVTAVDFTTPSITISGAAVTTNNTTHRVFRSGSGGTNVEVNGLQTIVSDADDNFQGVDTGDNPAWAAADVVDASTATLTDSLLEEVLDEVDQVSGEFPNIIVTDYGVTRKYADSLKDNKRFTNTVDLKGGFKAVSIDTPAGSINLMRDRDVPDGFAFVLNTKHLIFFIMSDWEWMNEDGAILSRVSGYDKYQAVLFKYANLATDRRNAFALISNLAH